MQRTIRTRPRVVGRRCAGVGSASGHSRRRASYRFRRPPASDESADSVTVTLAVHGARRYEVLWDGVSVTDRIASLAGEHHVVFVEVGARLGAVDQRARIRDFRRVGAGRRPCSSEDLAGVRSAREESRRCRAAYGARHGSRSAGPEPGHASIGGVQRRMMSTRGDLGVRNVRDVGCRSRTTEEERFARMGGVDHRGRRCGGCDHVRLVGKRSFRPRGCPRQGGLVADSSSLKKRAPRRSPAKPRGVRSANHRRSLR